MRGWAKLTRNAQSFQIEINGRENLEARAVVLAVAGDEGNPLLGGVGGWSVPEVRAWNRTTAFCYAAYQAPVDERIIMLNGEGHGAGPVNNVAVMTAVSAAYAPPGAHLVVAGVVGEAPQENAALMRLDDRVRCAFEKWFGPVVDSWKMLRAYPLAQALPQQRHAEWEQSPVRWAAREACTCVVTIAKRPRSRSARLRKTRCGGRDPRPGGQGRR